MRERVAGSRGKNAAGRLSAVRPSAVPAPRADHLACVLIGSTDCSAPVFLGRAFICLVPTPRRSVRAGAGSFSLRAPAALPGRRTARRPALPPPQRWRRRPDGAVRNTRPSSQLAKALGAGPHSLYHGNIRRRQAGIFPAECLDRIHHTQRPPLLHRIVFPRPTAVTLWVQLAYVIICGSVRSFPPATSTGCFSITVRLSSRSVTCRMSFLSWRISLLRATDSSMLRTASRRTISRHALIPRGFDKFPFAVRGEHDNRFRDIFSSVKEPGGRKGSRQRHLHVQQHKVGLCLPAHLDRVETVRRLRQPPGNPAPTAAP